MRINQVLAAKASQEVITVSPDATVRELLELMARNNVGALVVSSMEFGPVTPFPNGVAFIKGDINDPADWTVWSYGSSPLPHYQLGSLKFGPRGDLWVSAISEGVVRIPTGNPPEMRHRP